MNGCIGKCLDALFAEQGRLIGAAAMQPTFLCWGERFVSDNNDGRVAQTA